jgi:hypothetical protein
MEVVIGNKFILGKKIGGGSFGNIYEGIIQLIIIIL